MCCFAVRPRGWDSDQATYYPTREDSKRPWCLLPLIGGDCDFTLWNKPLAEPCPKCDHPILTRKTTKDKGEHIACPKKGCGYTRPIEESGE